MAGHIIIVEDEADLADLVALHLQREHYEVAIHHDGSSGLEAITDRVPDLVVLDLMLPGLDGFEVCRRMRRGERTAGIPILMLTARGEEIDVVTGLELGADDYLIKPFSPRVLVARVRALLRRSSREDDAEVLRLGEIEIDSGRHEVRIEGELVTLTASEYGILDFLARRPGRVRTRAEILERIGGGASLDRTVDVHMAALRRKLGPTAERIETVRGVGYRLRE